MLDDLTAATTMMQQLRCRAAAVKLYEGESIMLDELKQQVYAANMELPQRGLITLTWGNVSGIDRAAGLFVIKPSGVAYDTLRPEDMVVVDLAGKRVEGRYN